LNLPLIEYPVRGATAALIFFSGDGGWRDLDKQIGELLAQRGVAVIGVDCLRYFWRAKAPERIAADLDAIMRTYGKRWNVTRFALAGYSFGADVLPFAYNRLALQRRSEIAQVSLLGLEDTAIFEFKLEGWFRDVAGQPVLPELRRMPPQILQCFFGEEEKDTLCRAPEMAAAELIRTSGSHHFDGDYAALARIILAGLDRRARSSAADHSPQATADQRGDIGENDR
jgi:type IV secretory pathway VirJ component